MKLWRLLPVVVVCLTCTNPSEELRFPEVRHDEHWLDFADERGEVADVLAAHAFFLDTESLEALHAAAVRKEPRPLRVWEGMEVYAGELGGRLADRVSVPKCLAFPTTCTVDWTKFDGLSRTEPGGVRMRQLLAESFQSRAHRRGLKNRLALSLVNTPLAGVMVRGTLGRVAAEAGAAELSSQVPAVLRVDPATLRWSQTSAGGSGRAAALRTSMAEHGYVGEPIDVVRTADGLLAIDNTRPAVALELGIKEIPVIVHLPEELLPASMTGRFGAAKTWGEAAAYRTARQRPPLGPTGTPNPPPLRE